MTDDELVADYLRRLERAARALPRPRRRELVDEIAEHIVQAWDSSADAGDPAALRNALERLGEPEDIVAAAAGGLLAPGPGGMQITAVLLLLFGGIAGLVLGFAGVIVGWGAGVVLLWVSPRWRWPDKLLGTLVWPGGYGTLVVLMMLPGQECAGAASTCTGFALPPGLGIAVLVAAVAGPAVVAVRLLRQARWLRDQGEPAASPLAT